MNQFLALLLSIFTLLTACSGVSKDIDLPKNETKSNPKHSTDTISIPETKLKDTTYYFPIKTDSLKVKIVVPKNIKGYLLFLHGWNLPSNEMCDKTNFCQVFLDSGYVLIFPDFGKTTYQWENYPQTKKSYLKYPTRRWIKDTFMVHLQNDFRILLPGERSFVFGVSTGGRGAALLALENPKIFKAAACLSADFDHAKLVDEPINNGYYGPIKSFPERWHGKDNIHNRASEFNCGLYLAHGEKDKVCPVNQTVNFSKELLKLKVNIPLETNIDPIGDHTYVWWGKQISSVITFFDKF